MPTKPLKPCAQPRCPELTKARFCSAHQREEWKRVDQGKDPRVRAWYKSARWERLRQQQLDQHPLCQCGDCREGALLTTPATVVDHRTPHRGDAALFFDPGNLMSMSKRHHDRKTASEDGGFGNRTRSSTSTGVAPAPRTQG